MDSKPLSWSITDYDIHKNIWICNLVHFCRRMNLDYKEEKELEEKLAQVKQAKQTTTRLLVTAKVPPVPKAERRPIQRRVGPRLSNTASCLN